MNISLKDSARDQLMPTIKPCLLVGNHTYVGGEVNLMQIGKKRQMMYDAAYDRTGKDLSGSLDELASYSNRLSSTTLPAWLSAPTLEAPIDEERLRFNTSQNIQSITSPRTSRMPKPDSRPTMCARSSNKTEKTPPSTTLEAKSL